MSKKKVHTEEAAPEVLLEELLVPEPLVVVENPMTIEEAEAGAMRALRDGKMLERAEWLDVLAKLKKE